ncbi:MAG: Coenzyme F420 hydrogenase/dehydrogenase, beta subunit C-terminal domain [Eubacterium sp.]
MDKNTCVGCSACVSVCTKNCIKMIADKEGFSYPQIDTDKCVSCGMCDKVCPVLHPATPVKASDSYAVYSNSDEVRLNSSSGGAFYHLAEYVIKNGGIVFGAAFDSDWNVSHIAVDKIEDLPKVQRSKYLQSNTIGVFEKVKNALNDGKLVLFSGTPCQCSGLSLYLNKDYDNLILVDFICHGIPSPLVWQKYLSYISKGRAVKNVNFRDKSPGWQNYNFTVEYNDGTRYSVPFFESTYMKLFLKDCILRPSCYNCSSKYPNKYSDITLGDLWGADNLIPNHDNKGITLTLINSEKGRKTFDVIKDDFNVAPVDSSEAFKYNPCALTSSLKPENRQSLFDYMASSNYDFDEADKKFLQNKDSLIKKSKRAVKRIIKKIAKV